MCITRKDIFELQTIEGDETVCVDDYLDLVRRHVHFDIISGDLDIFIPECLRYAQFPRAKEVYGHLANVNVADSGWMPQTGLAIPERFPDEWSEKIIICFGDLFEIQSDRPIFGFKAFSFGKDRILKQHFVPMDAKLRSVHYALVHKKAE